MKIIVLGAGVTGVTTAYYLNQAGHDVTVLERQPAAGLETSKANGGQISVSHAEPWANPGAPLKLLKWLGKEDAPLLFRLRADLHQWLWGAHFLRECTPARTRHNITQLVQLGLYSRAQLQALRTQTGIEYDQRAQGILHFYTSESEWKAAQEPAQIMRDHGCELLMKTPDECVAIEPALAQARNKLVGGSFTPTDESGDAFQFTQNLSKIAAQNGVKFSYNTSVHALRHEGGKLSGVEINTPEGGYTTLTADAYVMCMGSYGPQLLESLGINLMIYPAKGYSLTMPVLDEAKAHQVSLTDDEYKLVFSRLGNRLRIAGTAELNGYSMDLNLARCQALVRRTEELFPGAGDVAKAKFWTGLRPATPSNIPYIGRSKMQNLFLNTGHGTLGWTHACGSASLLTQVMSGQKPAVDFAFCG